MAQFPNSESYHGVMSPFWLEPVKKDVMGYKLTNVASGDIIERGTPIETNEKEKTAVVCKYAVVLKVATDKKTLTVKPGHHLKAGDTVGISGGTLASLTIASVGKDTIVLSAQNNTVKEGSVLVEVKTEESTVVVKNKPNRIVTQNETITDLNATCSGAHDAIVLQNVVHYPAEYLNENTFPGSILLVGCPKIMFIYQ